MSLEVMSREILERANLEKQQILEDCNQEVSRLEQESKERILEYSTSLKKSLEEEFNLKKTKYLSEKSLEYSLKEKEIFSSLLSQVKEEVVALLSSLDVEKKTQCYTLLLKQASSLLDFTYLICSEADKELFASLVDSNVVIEVSKNITFGARVFSKDKKESVDFTIGELVKQYFTNYGVHFKK
jgi:vacuolar-type H+-ATPase subunit E/Vma4